MKAALSAVLLLAALPLGAQKAGPPRAAAAYVPDLRLWRMEVTPALGGWSSDRKVDLRIKLVDPKDPDPPREESRPWSGEDDEEESGFRPPEEDARSAEQLRQERLAREAEAARQAWRYRTLTVWFNGATLSWSVRVGSALHTELTAQNGENRLEILEPTSGLRVVRSWWVSTSRTRLQVSVLRNEGEWASGGLQVLEPDGAVAEGGRRTPSGGLMRWSGDYNHEAPPPGTYTLRWTGGWRGGRPARTKVEVTLDGGTDQERRWIFERLILPGAGPVTLGTFDVEP